MQALHKQIDVPHMIKQCMSQMIHTPTGIVTSSYMISAGRIQTQLMCAKAKGTQCYQTDFHRLYPAGYETMVYLTSDKISQAFPVHICTLESMKYWEATKPWEQG